MRDIEFAVEACRTALGVGAQVVLPVLAIGLLVGLLVSVFQAATQIQDQTLSFVPKIVATVVALFALLPWILSILVEYTREALVRASGSGGIW